MKYIREFREARKVKEALQVANSLGELRRTLSNNNGIHGELIVLLAVCCPKYIIIFIFRSEAEPSNQIADSRKHHQNGSLLSATPRFVSISCITLLY
jgi:hypothetical protein